MNQAPRKLPASRGWHWIHSAFALVRKHPSVFVLMGLIFGLITWVPLLGGLLLLVAGPALVAGTVVAARTAEAGGRPFVRQMLCVLADPAQRGEALKLCIPLVIGKIAAGMVLAIAATARLLEQGMQPEQLEQNRQKLMALLFSQDMLAWWGVALLLVLLAWSFTALAIPKVALQHKRAFPSMLESLHQVWRNPGAWLLTVLTLFSLLLAVTWVLWLTRIPALAQLGIYTTLYTLLGPILYAAWRDLGDDDHAPPPPPSGDDQASPPPPPRGVLEA